MSRFSLTTRHALFSAVALCALAALFLVSCQAAEPVAKPDVVRLDYATYNPVSLILKNKGLVEKALEADGVKVEWLQSTGSNKALQYLQGSSVDFGSTAGAAALLSVANSQNPIRIVYLYSRPEWTALVTGATSTIAKIEDLKGKKVAATLGTDPYIFLLRSLASVGLSDKDIELVSLQHADGATALVKGEVDAWAGLDPHMARVELEAGAKLFYRNTSFNTFGVLNVRSEFAEKYPEYVKKIIAVYEEGRKYALDHLDETAAILAQEASIKPEVATKQITERTDLSVNIPGDDLKNALLEAGKVLQAGGHIKTDANVEALVTGLIDPSFATQIVK